MNENRDIKTELKIVDSHSTKLVDVLEELYRSSYKMYVGFAVLLILPKEVAEEIVQDVFTSILARAISDKTMSLDDPEKYVKSAIALKARNHHRHNFLKKTKLGVVRNEQIVDSQESYGGSEELDRLNNIVDLLPRAQKECVVLKYHEGFKISEIAELLNISEGTVKSHLFRATSTIKSELVAGQAKDAK